MGKVTNNDLRNAGVSEDFISANIRYNSLFKQQFGYFTDNTLTQEFSQKVNDALLYLQSFEKDYEIARKIEKEKFGDRANFNDVIKDFSQTR